MLIDYQKPTEYDEYLQSDHWLETVRIKRWVEGNKCEICGSPHKLQVHHLTYERLGRENLSDLQLVCEYHHKKIHNIDDRYSTKLTNNLKLVLEKLAREVEANTERSARPEMRRWTQTNIIKHLRKR